MANLQNDAVLASPEVFFAVLRFWQAISQFSSFQLHWKASYIVDESSQIQIREAKGD